MWSRLKSTARRGGAARPLCSLAPGVVVWIAAALPVQASADSDGDERGHSVEITFQNDRGHLFDARIDLPEGENRSRTGILLVGGASVTDMDWTVPGCMTLNGEPTKDAAGLGRALAREGYPVFRWTSFRRDDPIHAENPVMATAYPYADTVTHTRLAMRAFRESELVDADRIVLVGHSNGARRACEIASRDPGVVGLVLLAGGGLIRTGYTPEQLNVAATGLHAEMDRDGDGVATQREFDAWQAEQTGKKLIRAQRFVTLDRNGDNVLNAMEIATQLVMEKREDGVKNTAGIQDIGDASERIWGEDVVASTQIPVLMLYGERDGSLMNGYVVAERMDLENRQRFVLRAFPKLDHQLGTESDHKTGPMSLQVIACIAQWLNGQFADVAPEGQIVPGTAPAS